VSSTTLTVTQSLTPAALPAARTTDASIEFGEHTRLGMERLVRIAK
jgi:hypothetical protein